MIECHTETHLQDERLHGLRVLVSVGQVLHLLSGLLEQLLEVLLTLPEDLKSGLVESGGLSTVGQLKYSRIELTSSIRSLPACASSRTAHRWQVSPDERSWPVFTNDHRRRRPAGNNVSSCLKLCARPAYLLNRKLLVGLDLNLASLVPSLLRDERHLVSSAIMLLPSAIPSAARGERLERARKLNAESSPSCSSRTGSRSHRGHRRVTCWASIRCVVAIKRAECFQCRSGGQAAVHHRHVRPSSGGCLHRTLFSPPTYGIDPRSPTPSHKRAVAHHGPAISSH